MFPLCSALKSKRKLELELELELTRFFLALRCGHLTTAPLPFFPPHFLHFSSFLVRSGARRDERGATRGLRQHLRIASVND